MSFFLNILFIMVCLPAMALPEDPPKYKILNVQGRSYVDREKAVRGMTFRVGNTLRAKDEGSTLDASFLESAFRLQNAELTVIESNPLKNSPEKMLLEKGKAYIYVDKRLGKNLFHMANPHFILTVKGEYLEKPARVYLVVQKDKSMVFVLSGQMDVTIARISKKYLIVLNEGDYLESNGKDEPRPKKFDRPLKAKMLQNIFTQFEASLGR